MPPSSVSPMTLKRIHREVADLKKEDMGAMTLAPSDDNLFLWKGQIPGPEGSVYEGGIFNLDVTLAPDYPFTAPRVMFKTRIYHMNISERGDLCIDILKNNWSPALSLFKVLLSISSLLTDPNPRDPLVSSIANQYTTDRNLHDSTARRWTELYARPKPPSPPVASSSIPDPASTVALSARARGKARASAIVNSAPASASSSTSRSVSQASDTITIDDSDDEAQCSQLNTNAGRVSGAKRKRSNLDTSEDGSVVVLSDDEDEAVAKGRGSQKRRIANMQTPTSTNDSEVIVIDSDDDI